MWVASLRFRSFYLRERTLVPTEYEVGWPSESVWGLWSWEKSFAPAGKRNTSLKFYILLAVHLVMILGKWPTWRIILFYVFTSVLYMFRATSCSSSGESIVSVQHLVYVILCWWLFSVQVGNFFFRPAHETVTDTEWYIPDIVLIKLILLMMIRRLLETCRELKSVSGRSCDRPPRHRFFLVSLCLQANAEMVPKFPSCYYMPVM